MDRTEKMFDRTDCAVKHGVCRDCPTAVFHFAGRFFIRAGHPGFNLPANNRNGWGTRSAATKAVRKIEAACPA